jgi:O-6-methylguanine DNA methyltransferase
MEMKTSMSFRDRVYAEAAKIPKGKVATYGQIARLAGSPRAARAVGQLMAKNKDTKRVPCHRVVGSGGALTGYAFNGVSEKRKKLIDEGVSFSGTRVNMQESRWLP